MKVHDKPPISTYTRSRFKRFKPLTQTTPVSSSTRLQRKTPCCLRRLYPQCCALSFIIAVLLLRIWLYNLLLWPRSYAGATGGPSSSSRVVNFYSGREAKIAFFIQVSDLSIRTLPRLLSAVWHSSNIYAIHIDVKADVLERVRVEQVIREQDLFRSNNVILLESEPVSYAGITMLLNTINAISVVLNKCDSWDYFINLSGSDYPLVSPLKIRQLLGSAPVHGAHINFVQNQSSSNNMKWFIAHRIGKVHIDTSLWIGDERSRQNFSTYGLRDLNVTLPVEHEHIPLFKTEGWVILHRTFAQYVVDSRKARRLLVSLATARAADELFFGTLLMTTPAFRGRTVWDAFRFMDWGVSTKLLSRPKFLDQDKDTRRLFDRMSRSGALFARKFLYPDSALKKNIDSNLSGIARNDNRVSARAVRGYQRCAYFRMLRALNAL